MQIENLITPIKSITLQAGEIILKHFMAANKVDVTIKSDNSPVTIADFEADQYITSEISSICDIPIISEESIDKSLPTSSAYFLIDPLDGTKSFISGSPDFTVNIALIQNGVATHGFVYQPAAQKLFYTDAKGRAILEMYDTNLNLISTKHLKCDGKPADNKMRVVASKNHLSAETAEYISKIDVAQRLDIGSSLKFCLLAEGFADVYPRFSPTMLWDTAAAHAVLSAAGGSVTLTDETTPLNYHLKGTTHSDLLNPSFIAFGW